MERRIIWSNKEYLEFINILKQLEPVNGYTGKTLVEAIASFANKYYTSTIRYVSVPGLPVKIVCSTNSTISTEKQTISIRHIIDDLLHSKIIQRHRDKGRCIYKIITKS